MNAAVTKDATARKSETSSRRRSMVLLSLALGTALSALVVLASTAPEAETTFPETNARITFASERTMGVDNPTGDSEIFTIKPDGTGLTQLTFSTVNDYEPVFSPDGMKIAHHSAGRQTSNADGDSDVYLMNAVDGSGQINLSNNAEYDGSPD